MILHVHVERLVVDSVAVDGARASSVRAAVEAELARLLAQGDVDRLGRRLAGMGDMDSVQAPPAAWSPGGRPERLGHAVAQSAYRAMARGGEGGGRGA